MNSNPLVSVIITNYNYARYLGEAIDNVLNQSYRNFELIIVDDGSKDNSTEIIQDYSQKFPDKIIPILKENGGQASAFNAGFRASRGEIISFLDSDDFWKPERLKEIVNVFQKGIYSIVQHNMEIADEHSHSKGKLYREGLFSGDAKKLLLDYCHLDLFVPTSGVCFRRDALDKILPVPESWKICADAYLTRIVLFYGFLYSFEQPLGYYRIHENNKWMYTKQQKKTDIVPLIIDAINVHLANKGYGFKVDVIKNPLYRYKDIGQRPGLLEPFIILKMLPLFPFMSFKDKVALAIQLNKIFIVRLYYRLIRLYRSLKKIEL